jgi:membrane glycosyltransferase
MRKAGYEVWLAYDIGDSFEELPPTLLDYAQRDRRWCQGNLQHGWIALFGNIPLMNRIHMLNGIYAYLAAPLWLLFLSVSTLAAYSWGSSHLSLIVREQLLPWSPHDLIHHGLNILAITLSLIFLPKFFTIVRLLIQPKFRQRFGGAVKATGSIGIEVLCFSLMAPALMLFHSAFVFSILTGDKVRWASQNRTNAAHTTWIDAVRAHIGQTTVGILWALLTWRIDPSLFYLMSPVLLGWLISIPLSVITSHTDAAHWLREEGFLLTPEEQSAPAIIRTLHEIEAKDPAEPQPIEALRNDFGLIQVVLDPFINALHLEFLPSRKNQTAETSQQLKRLEERLINEGAPSLSTEEKDRILSDPNTVRELNRRIWTMSDDELHRWWHLAMRRYSRQSLFVAELDSAVLSPQS